MVERFSPVPLGYTLIFQCCSEPVHLHAVHSFRQPTRLWAVPSTFYKYDDVFSKSFQYSRAHEGNLLCTCIACKPFFTHELKFWQFIGTSFRLSKCFPPVYQRGTTSTATSRCWLLHKPLSDLCYSLYKQTTQVRMWCLLVNILYKTFTCSLLACCSLHVSFNPEFWTYNFIHL